MEDFKRTEKVTVTYKNGVILVLGTTFAVEAKISSTELSKVYWGNKGSGTASVLIKGKK